MKQLKRATASTVMGMQCSSYKGVQMAVSEHLGVKELLFRPDNYTLHIAIALIAITLIATIIYEMRKPLKDPNQNKDTKRMNDILKD